MVLITYMLFNIQFSCNLRLLLTLDILTMDTLGRLLEFNPTNPVN